MPVSGSLQSSSSTSTSGGSFSPPFSFATRLFPALSPQRIFIPTWRKRLAWDLSPHPQKEPHLLISMTPLHLAPLFRFLIKISLLLSEWSPPPGLTSFLVCFPVPASAGSSQRLAALGTFLLPPAPGQLGPEGNGKLGGEVCLEDEHACRPQRVVCNCFESL